MIRKLRAGMMPPPGARRPDAARSRVWSTRSKRAWIDARGASIPNPGWRPFQRLNRAEYARAVRDLLDLDVDVTAFLPPDTISDGFDNVADAQTFSPTLMEGYLRAASRISDARGRRSRQRGAAQATYKLPKTASQMARVEGAPIGTRGGISVDAHVPGRRRLRVPHRLLRRAARRASSAAPRPGEQIEVSIDGERVALFDINPRMSEAERPAWTLKTPPVHVKAGPQRVSAAFLQRFEGPVDDLIAPIDHTLADTEIGIAFGITTLPHLRDLTIVGPHQVTGVSDTPSRRKSLHAAGRRSRPKKTPCAADDRQAPGDAGVPAAGRATRLDALMTFYDAGRKERDFEAGVAQALEAILASPQFLFRLESRRRRRRRPGETYRLGDLELASRLSFFLWGTAPDAELLKAAGAGHAAHAGGASTKQVRRMLADPRSEALATRFASQWLRLQDLEQVIAGPDPVSRTSTRRCRQALQARDRAVLRQPRARGPQRPRPAHGRLHVRQRAARAALRHSPTSPATQFRRVTLPEPIAAASSATAAS